MISQIEFFYKKRRFASSSRPGGHSSSIKGTGMIFDKLVTLINNPDPRRLDIMASLKDPFEQWWVREYRQRASIPVVALLDLSTSVSFEGENDNVFFLMDFLKSLSRSTYRMGDRLGLVGFDNSIKDDWYYPPSSKRIINNSLIEKLFKNIEFQRGHNGIKILHTLLPKEPGLVFFVSDFHISLDLFEKFIIDSPRQEIVPIVIQDLAEVSGWKKNGVSLLSDSETNRKRLVWIGNDWRKKIEDSYKNRNERIKKICSKYNIYPLFMSGKFESERVSSHFLMGDLS